MTETAPSSPDQQDGATVYTAYELDFMLNLRPTPEGAISREQIGLRSAPEQARDYVVAAVTSGLHARGKVSRTDEGQWLLGEEAQVVATALTAADRWMGVALAQGEAMRMAFVIKANQAVLMLTQDELDSFAITALPSPEEVPAAIGGVCEAFLAEAGGQERTVSLRRADGSAPQEPTPLMFHVEADGSWKIGHLPLGEDGILTVSDLPREAVVGALKALWEDGRSEAPQANGTATA